MVEPITCVPSAALIIPAATPAAEPLLDPPGVRRRSCGLRVPRGSLAANSVVTVFPTITAPASRNAATLAASRSERKPANSGEPFSVGMSAVSMMSLMPTGMPSILDSGRPCAPARRGPVGGRARAGEVEIDEGADLGFERREIGKAAFKKIAWGVGAARKAWCGRKIWLG